MDVKLHILGRPRRVPAAINRGAFRVVRGALAKAADASAASVAIEYVPGALVVEVTDDGSARNGFDELVELGAALGGGVKAAPAPDGFRVRAWLPTEGRQPSLAAPPAARSAPAGARCRAGSPRTPCASAAPRRRRA